MHYYRFYQDKLYCEGLPVQGIAENIDTPFYLYSQKTLVENYERISTAFQAIDHLICYALKANSNVSLLSLLAQRGAGADVVSGGEIYLALKSGFLPEKIVFAGVGKTDAEIQSAVEQDILALNVESFAELQVVNDIAKNLHKKAPITIRINPNIDIQGHPYISTGKAVDKFGIEISEAKEMFHKIHSFSNTELIGLHCHIGSQITEVNSFLKAIQLLKETVKELHTLGVNLRLVDIGGGLGVNYENIFQENLNSKEKDLGDVLTPEELVDKLKPDLQEMSCKIIFEPGRALIAESGILVTKVLYKKEIQGKRFLVVDAGMNDLIRPSLYGAYHEIVPVSKNGNDMVMVDVVGPVCESGDFLARDRWLPQVNRGEYLAVMTAGAYGFSLSSNYNARPRPAEVLVEGNDYKIIRERGSIENLWL
ncbi:MAG: diaminopimelate decarboxylase [bacterium]